MPTFIYASQRGPNRHLVINAFSKEAADSIIVRKLGLEIHKDYICCGPKLEEGQYFCVEHEVVSTEVVSRDVSCLLGKL